MDNEETRFTNKTNIYFLLCGINSRLVFFDNF